MPDRDSARPWWTRREFIRSSAALAAGRLRDALGSRARGRKFRSSSTARNFSSRRPSPTRNAAACCASASPIGRRISTCTSPARSTISAPRGCMFDNLIRRDPRDSGKTIIPDLAHSWEISKDGKTYTFILREGVQFHDGAELTAEDVKATFDRIVKPPPGRQHPAQRAVQGGRRDQGSRQAHGAVRAGRTAPGQASSCRRSPAAGT